jgi:flagellar biosynthesis protein FlhB
VNDKTEEPTPRRLRKARDEGDSGVSGYAAQSLAFVVAAALAPATVRAVAVRSGDELRRAVLRAAVPRSEALVFDAAWFATMVLILAVPLLVAVGAAGVVAHVVQTGGTLATRRLTPKLERLNVAAGFKNLFSATRLFAVVRALVAGGAVGWLTYEGLRDHVVDLAHTSGQVPRVAAVVSSVAGSLMWRAAALGLLLGAVDLVVTRRAWHRRLRMTKDEVRREHRESEGDPQLKAARERAYHDMLAQATIQNVKNASVVVINPLHLACALRYDETLGDQAPIVLASGQGDIAAGIVQVARDYAVPVVRDVPLARALIELSAGDAIPEGLYDAVAEILREVWEREGDREESKTQRDKE